MSAPASLFLAALAVAGAYAAMCWLSPYGPCLRCAGRGRCRSLILRREVNCWWCRACGSRLRVGRRIYNVAAKAHREGQAKRTERELADK